MNRMFRNTAALALVGAFVVAATGCNTMRGVGKDTEKVGEEIQEAADEHDRSQSETQSRPVEPAKQSR